MFGNDGSNLDEFILYPCLLLTLCVSSHFRSPAKMSIETSANGKPFCFHYLMQSNLVYLTLTESSYPKRLAFLYLDEVADAFLEYLTSTYGDQYFRQVETTARPFAFIQADPIIQRKQREFIDPIKSYGRCSSRGMGSIT